MGDIQHTTHSKAKHNDDHNHRQPDRRFRTRHDRGSDYRTGNPRRTPTPVELTAAGVSGTIHTHNNGSFERVDNVDEKSVRASCGKREEIGGQSR